MDIPPQIMYNHIEFKNCYRLAFTHLVDSLAPCAMGCPVDFCQPRRRFCLAGGIMNNIAQEKQVILIVDDSQMNRAILADMLEDKFQILEAEDGEQGIAMLQ